MWVSLFVIYSALFIIAWQRGWVQVTYHGAKNALRPGGGQPAAGKPDYAKIAKLEDELGIGKQLEIPEPPATPLQGETGRLYGAWIGVEPEDPTEYLGEIYAWGRRDPVRKIDYRKRPKDPAPKLPDPPDPQPEIK